MVQVSPVAVPGKPPQHPDFEAGLGLSPHALPGHVASLQTAVVSTVPRYGLSAPALPGTASTGSPCDKPPPPEFPAVSLGEPSVSIQDSKLCLHP